MNKKRTKKSRYAKRVKSQSKSSPLAWLTGGILIGLIVPGIFLLKSHSSKKSSPVPIVTEITGNEHHANQNQATTFVKKNAPSKEQKEQYEFYNLLSSQEEDTASQFFLQIATFTSYIEADQLKAKLLLTGIDDITIAKKTVGEHTSYKVLAGPFESKNEANKVQQQLKESSIDSVLVVKD